jgi:hypothetical protein
MGAVAYNPNDPTQQGFLSALALGESGPNGSTSIGFGGASTSGAPTDQYGFPIWSGATTAAGATHASGIFQFEPSTWDNIASTYGLNFSSANDQEAGAWYLAQQADPNLETDLQSGNYGTIQSALAKIWPSVTGSGSAPQGLAQDLASGVGASLPGASGGSSAASSTAAQGTGIVATIENFFVRFGLIIIGGIIVIVALWQILSNRGIVPSPADTGKAVAKGAGELALAA